jgi:hypothetical protein
MMKRLVGEGPNNKSAQCSLYTLTIVYELSLITHDFDFIVCNSESERIQTVTAWVGLARFLKSPSPTGIQQTSRFN